MKSVVAFGLFGGPSHCDEVMKSKDESEFKVGLQTTTTSRPTSWLLSLRAHSALATRVFPFTAVGIAGAARGDDDERPPWYLGFVS